MTIRPLGCFSKAASRIRWPSPKEPRGSSASTFASTLGRRFSLRRWLDSAELHSEYRSWVRDHACPAIPRLLLPKREVQESGLWLRPAAGMFRIGFGRAPEEKETLRQIKRTPVP